jgi:hypothetical protein
MNNNSFEQDGNSVFGEPETRKDGPMNTTGEPQPKEYEKSVSFDEINESQMGYKASVWISDSGSELRDKMAHHFEGSGADIKQQILKAANGDLHRVKRIFLESPY